MGKAGLTFLESSFELIFCYLHFVFDEFKKSWRRKLRDKRLRIFQKLKQQKANNLKTTRHEYLLIIKNCQHLNPTRRQSNKPSSFPARF